MARRDPRELFELAADLPDLDGAVMVQALDGFVDAGAGKRLLREHLLRTAGASVVATFDVDELIDYRARRPLMTFAEDHWADYAEPRLAVHLLHDADGTPFLLLAGPEPDVQWERFVAAVVMLVEELGVQHVVGVNAIPMAVPHTRPLGIIGHGSRPELVVEAHTGWAGTVQVPSSAGNLLEYRLGQAGYDASGFSVAVPHYVSEAEYPAAAVALAQSVCTATGLTLPTAELEEAAVSVRAAVDEQVGQNDEVASVVTALEGQYDSWVAGSRRSLLGEAGELPTADQLGAELERFLAEQSGPADPPPPPA